MLMMDPELLNPELFPKPEEIQSDSDSECPQDEAPPGYVPYPSFTPEDAEKNKGRYIREDLVS